MEAAPTYDFWWRFAAILFAEVSVMAVAAWALEKFRSSGVWRRSIWHVCLIGLVALVAAGVLAAGEVAEGAHPATVPTRERPATPTNRLLRAVFIQGSILVRGLLRM